MGARIGRPGVRKCARRGSCQTACKPGSVRPLPGRTAIPLGRALLRASRDQPGRQGGIAPASRSGGTPKRRRPPLFGLAPGGVYPAAPVAGSAVRSYRTVSPLPAGGCPLASAVYFLWHFPWGRPRRPLAGTVIPWSPDFPPPWARTRGSGRPAVWRYGNDAVRPLRQSSRAPSLPRASPIAPCREGAYP
jgi:hypothetical protein